MSTTPLDLARLGPAGGKRSSKRDLIVDVFLKQEGHLSADDLVDMIRREDQRISRATVYRTLQWMVDAGIARKVDFGEGRFRFEHSYRHPRHFHLICKTCNQSSEFLSSDIEALIEEVAAARNFAARQSVVQIYGECEDCRMGRSAAPINGARPSCSSRATRCASRLPPSAAAWTSTRARRPSRAIRAAGRSSSGWPRRRASTSARSNSATKCCSRVTRSSNRARRFSSSRARPTACSPKAPSASAAASTTSRRYMIGIRCERGSHRFFKRYGERFEDSEGKQIFLEFADEERQHLDLLIREYKALVKRQGRARGKRNGSRPVGKGSAASRTAL